MQQIFNIVHIACIKKCIDSQKEKRKWVSSHENPTNKKGVYNGLIMNFVSFRAS